jgi:demethylmenaquinone methyltransferase/2-methoxy-6-polyprenyl-1,4-benzoquinol methylase
MSAANRSAGNEPGTLEAAQVSAMFNRIAGVYDLLNTVMSAGLHHEWRRRAADLAQIGPGDRVLDVAAGTGDLTIELAGRVRPDGEVIGCDFSEEMLLRARAKAPDLRFDSGNVLDLHYGDDEFDAVTVGFGARNFADLERGLREMVRVVRPGGRVLVLDFTTPRRPPLSTFFHLWFDRVVPLLGRLVGAPDAYGYLSHSVRRFPAPAKLAELMESCGMCSIRYIITGGGIVTMHVGTVVSSGAAATGNGHHIDTARA